MKSYSTSPPLLVSTSLQNLPDPTIIDSLDYESILDEVKSDLLHFLPELKDALHLESEPAYKIAQAVAYRLMHERQRANDQALSLMLAKASKAQLDHLGALPFIQTTRKVIVPANPHAVPPIDAVLEDDETYRARLNIALEGFSTAGPFGAYIYHGLAAHEEIKDIAVDAPRFKRLAIPPALSNEFTDHAMVLVPEYSAGLAAPMPGDVVVTVLTHNADSPNEAVIQAVKQALNDEKIRPLTDHAHVRAAEIITYQIEANCFFYPDVDPNIVLKVAQESIETYTLNRNRIGHDVTLSGIYAAIHCAGIQRVVLAQPLQDLIIEHHQASRCLKITLNNGGVAV